MKNTFNEIHNMKRTVTLIFFLSLFVVTTFANTIGHTNNGALSETLWSNGSWIVMEGILANTNMTITNLMTQVSSSTGNYKCAVYAGSAITPTTLLRGSYEVTAPTTGWYSFPFTNTLSLTNGQYYWFAVWASGTDANIYYNSGTGLITWGQFNYGMWPSPITMSGSGGGQQYSIYATNISSVVTPSTQTVIVAWDASPSTNVAGYKFFYGGTSRTYTNTVNVGNYLYSTNHNLLRGGTYYFAATAYTSNNLESMFSDELVYTVPTNTLSKPIFLKINSVQP